MTPAWIIMIAVTVLCLLYVFRTILRQHQNDPKDDAGQSFLKIRQQEVDEELASGRLTAHEAAQLQQDVISEAEYIQEHGALALNRKVHWARVLLAAMVAIIVVGAFTLYERLGFAPDVRFTQKMLDQSANDEDISTFLNYRVERYDRAEDWYYLASEQVLAQDYPAAIASYRMVLQKLDEASADRINVQVELAQAMFYANHNTVSQPMREVVAEVLVSAPNNVKALGLQGIIDFDGGHYRDAILTWQKAIQLGTDRQERFDLLSGIAAARKQGGITEEQVPALISHRLQLKLDVVQGAVGPEDVYLVYARTQGQAMPVAIQRISAQEFDAPLVLTNIDNLMPGKTLADVPSVDIVVKRASKSAQDLSQGEIVGQLLSVPSRSDKIFKVKVSL